MRHRTNALLQDVYEGESFEFVFDTVVAAADTEVVAADLSVKCDVMMGVEGCDDVWMMR